MKKLLILWFILSLYNCDILKKSAKIKTDRVLTEQVETITKRKGDTVTFTVPKVIYKDTTIIKTNYVTGTTQVLRYDKKGQIDLAQCISGAIEEIRRKNKELIENIKEKEKDKEEKFDSDLILYGFFGIGVILIILLVAFVVYLNSFKRYLK